MQTKILWFAAILQLLIEFRVSSQEPGTSPIEIDEVCGRRIFTEPTGAINFTGLRFASSRNSTCNYRIEVGEDNFVSLKFLYFDLPTHLDFCNRDWVTLSCISDEISDTLTRKSPLLCGQTKWSSALKLSECPVLSVEIVFSSDLIFDRKGFHLQYEISPAVRGNTSDENAIPEIECGETFLTNQSGTIVLPNNPNITRAKLNCTYTISASEPDTLIALLTLDVSYIDLLTLTDDIDGCQQDNLQIRCSDENEQDSDSSGCAIFSSNSLSSPLYRGCLTLEITLQSDSYDPRETRLINYDMTVESEDDDTFDHGGHAICGNSTYQGQTGNVISPHFPLPHPANLNCTYRIAVGRQNVLSMKFLEFNLEGSIGSCIFDWITITCVLNSAPDFSTATKLCGHTRPGGLRYWNCSSVYIQFITDSSVQYGGFNIQYSLEHKDSVNITRIECGQTEFNTSDGVITSPSNPSGYMSQINCTYRVLANATSNFHLNVSSLNVTKLNIQVGTCIRLSCEGENTMSVNLCDRYGISSDPEFVLYNCHTLQIPIVSSFFELQESYQIPFKVIPSDGICGEKSYSESNGAISFPYIYRSYHPNTKCNYTIRGGKNTTISIAFDRSPYQYPDYRHCYDKITMFCLNSPNWNPYAGRRFCSQLSWPLVMHFFNCSTLLIAFSSLPYSVNAVGFSLNYTVSMGEIKDGAEDIPLLPCGSSLSTLSGTVVLPTQGGVPIASINCEYNISLNSISKGSISLDFAALSNAFDYNNDHRAVNLTILCSSDDDSAEINGTKSLTFGGGDLPRTLTEFSFSVCDSIRLSIQSSSYYPADNRYMSFKIKNTECGNVSFDGSTGNVMSPLFPLPYEKGLNCSYYIEVGDENVITLQFLTFSLSGISRDTPVRDHPMFDRYDDFRYSSHSPYHHDYKFGQEFNPFVNRLDSCYSDQLTIRCLFNGSQTMSDSKYLNRVLCGNKTVGLTTKIFGCQALRLEFITGDSGYSRMPGFNIHYHMQDANNSGVHCGNNSFNEPSGVITSPGYPDHYPNNINCTYAIKAGQNKSALIEVLVLDLQPPPFRYFDTTHYECTGDWLELSCSSEDATIANQLRNRRFCGHQRPFTMLLRGCEQVFIYFSTDIFAGFSGFDIRYKIYSEVSDEECGNAVFSNSTGIITSPGYPGPYPHRINCTYYIEVGSNNTLSLQLLSLDVGFVHRYHYYYYGDHYSKCPNDFMRITCSSRDAGETPFTSPYLNRQFCGNRHSFSATFRRCKQYAVEFFSGGNYSKSGFALHYTINKSEEQCGSTEFSNSTGVITSPGYPSYYEPHLNCVYYIDIGNNILLLHFLRIDISYGYRHYFHQQCSSDWLQITCVEHRDNASFVANEDINRKICGLRFNFSVTLDGCSRAAIQFFTNESIAPQRNQGFQLQYSIIKAGYCGYSSNNFTDAEGTIVSPYLLMERHIPTSCNYLISAQQMSTISLAITVIPTAISCFRHWLSIKCLDDVNSLSYTPNLCGAKYLYEKVVLPSCSSVQLIYPSNNSVIQFVISYRVTGPEEVCGKSVFSEPTGYISFPKSDPKYITAFNCSYSVVVGNHNSISFELSSFMDTTENNETLPDDWISIFCHGNNDNGQNKINHNDSIQSKEPVTLSFTNCSTVDVVFHSENQATRRRFNISYAIHSNYKPQAQRFVKTGSFGVLITFIVLLIVASLIALTFVWLRKRGTIPREDENTLTVADSESENPNSREKRSRGRFDLKSFIPFPRKNRNDQGCQKGFVPLESMASNIPRTSSEQSIQSNPHDISNDRIAILE